VGEDIEEGSHQSGGRGRATFIHGEDGSGDSTTSWKTVLPVCSLK